MEKHIVSFKFINVITLQVSSINRVLRNLSADTQKSGGPHLGAAGPGHVYGGLFAGQAWHRGANPWYSGAAVMHGAAGVAAAAGGLQAACIATQHRQLTQPAGIHPASSNIDRKCTSNTFILNNNNNNNNINLGFMRSYLRRSSK